MTYKKKKKLTKIIAFTLAAISIIVPCLSVASSIIITRRINKVIDAAATKERKLPIYCVDTKGKKQVAITFDAAWGSEDADSIIATLDKYGVKATFFCVGDFIRKYPDLVKKLSDAGHDIANHSNKHPHVNQMTKEAIKQDIKDANAEIKKVTGKDNLLYRPPYGEYNNTVIEAATESGMYTVQWDVDSIDWKGYDAQTIVNKVVNHKHLGDGTIILLHNGAKHTAEALPQLIEGLKQKGYEIVPISQLIYKDNFSIDHEGRQHPTSDSAVQGIAPAANSAPAATKAPLSLDAPSASPAA